MGVVSGLCAICQAPGAVHTCHVCGATVCPRHFRHGAGACTRHPEAGGEPGSDLPPRPPHGNA